MIIRDVVYLITEDPNAHGAFADKERKERKAFCTVGSVSRSEYYNAHNAGFEPSITLTLAGYKEYQGEKFCRFQGLVYNIIRTYILKTGGIELTLERSDVK